MAKRTGGPTRTDAVYEQLRSDILGGVLESGTRLKFPELCAKYDTSVGVAREALTKLVSAGLVQSEPHLGFVVTQLTLEDLAELTQARIELETLVLRLSIQEGDVDWEAQVVAAHHVLERTPFVDSTSATQSTRGWAEAHAAFHLALLNGCKNRRLVEIARTLRDEAELYRQWSVAPGRGKGRDVAKEHREIMQATVARDADRAVERLRDHIVLTTQLLQPQAEQEPKPKRRKRTVNSA
ncbi:GntR family transcriptional regulator [Kibdelosporangium philippinense]|uniref:GntR family transcriptional regulator n=1 Tax=Kibdelosporangium philippinense TaxID=211113 RepID=A0ABS8Z2Q4_9PSEU|nr:GntR family transcriptional regulator [Kibdelosporangium philippinense]MCE7001627.1 GntR family transcriptional regulator [Kibdelosporangium philippinense]